MTPCRISLTALIVLGLNLSHAAAADRVEFNRDIRPILSDNCFACHGPDEKTRQGGLRLDLAEHSRSKLASNKSAVVPGNVADSELVRRIKATDPGEQMPPADSGKHLTATQIELLKKWIDQGAEYQAHWSFEPLVRPAVPRQVAAQHLRRNAIDNFVQERLLQEHFQPSPEADRERLLRRVSFDLAGTPPSLEEIDDFLGDAAPDAYEKVVDRLLASPRYGERMALDWLDAARYADTHGFNNDTTRYMWRWRDWVIDAFNRGMPFDQFVTEQLAGDLLPEPTIEQRIATGFNRNHVINSEGALQS